MKRSFLLAISFAALLLGVPLHSAELPELEKVKGERIRVVVDGWTVDSRNKNRHYHADTTSPEFSKCVIQFLKGLDCIPIRLEGGIATSQVAKVQFHLKEGPFTFHLISRTYVATTSGAEYEIKKVNATDGDGLSDLLLRKLLMDFPELVMEVPRTAPPP